MAKADTLFEGRSNCHSGKYLLFHAKQNVSSPFQSTQLLSLAQKKVPFVGKFKKVLQVSHFEKVYFSSLFMLGQTQLHPSFPTDMLLLGFSLSLGLVLIEMTHFGSLKMIPS